MRLIDPAPASTRAAAGDPTRKEANMNGFFALLIGFSLSLALIGLWSAVSWYRVLGRSRLTRQGSRPDPVSPREWARIVRPGGRR